MSRNARISAAIIAVAAIVVAVVVGVAMSGGGDDDTAAVPTTTVPTTTAPAATAPTTTAPDGEAGVVLETDARILGVPGSSGVTFTEFLDFECESCAAVYPAVELLREEYAGRVTFAIRYFPLDGHRNSRTSAAAVEAAAQQGRLEDMYRRMYETQAEWGESGDSQAAVFRGFAEDLGLDMAAFDAAVASPATAARVDRDYRAAIALGLRGTPSFFVGERQIRPRTLNDVRDAIEGAIAGS